MNKKTITILLSIMTLLSLALTIYVGMVTDIEREKISGTVLEKRYDGSIFGSGYIITLETENGRKTVETTQQSFNNVLVGEDVTIDIMGDTMDVWTKHPEIPICSLLFTLLLMGLIANICR